MVAPRHVGAVGRLDHRREAVEIGLGNGQAQRAAIDGEIEG